MSKLEKFLKSLVKYEIPWCKAMGFKNPYIESFQTFTRDEDD